MNTFLRTPSFSSTAFFFLSISSHTLGVKSHLYSSSCRTWVICFCETQVYDLNIFMCCYFELVFDSNSKRFPVKRGSCSAPQRLLQDLKVQPWGTKALQTGAEEESDLWLSRRAPTIFCSAFFPFCPDQASGTFLLFVLFGDLLWRSERSPCFYWSFDAIGLQTGLSLMN